LIPKTPFITDFKTAANRLTLAITHHWNPPTDSKTSINNWIASSPFFVGYILRWHTMKNSHLSSPIPQTEGVDSEQLRLLKLNTMIKKIGWGIPIVTTSGWV